MKVLTLDPNKVESEVVDNTTLYNKATPDYEHWSKDYNMHFGYYTWKRTNPFYRDTMLNEMNRQVISRLGIASGKAKIIDLGCGMGGTMRYALKQNKLLSAFGVTLSDFHVTEGNKLLKKLRGTITKQDYTNTSFKEKTFDGALAIESFCHSGHNTRALSEAYRILKPGAKLIIADAFLKKNENKLCPGAKMSYSKLCSHWDLKRLGYIKDVEEELKVIGFKNVKIEDISFRVAPSVLHVPYAIFGFLLKQLFSTRPLKPESWHNLKGSFYALLSGMQLNSFGYYLVSCTKS